MGSRFLAGHVFVSLVIFTALQCTEVHLEDSAHPLPIFFDLYMLEKNKRGFKECAAL